MGRVPDNPKTKKKAEEGEEDGRCEVRSGKRLHGSKNVDVACM